LQDAATEKLSIKWVKIRRYGRFKNACGVGSRAVAVESVALEYNRGLSWVYWWCGTEWRRVWYRAGTLQRVQLRLQRSCSNVLACGISYCCYYFDPTKCAARSGTVLYIWSAFSGEVAWLKTEPMLRAMG
jgi:hypothetical protein